MSRILSGAAFEHLVLDYADSAHKCAQHWASAEDDALKVHLGSLLRSHDAALRSENEWLREALREIDQKTGHFGEAPPPPEWMPMLSLIAWVGRTARAALAGQEVARG